MLWWEDFAVGETLEMGSHRFGEDEIIAFARQFDPQPFHTDPQAAARSAFGGLIASGWPVRPGDTIAYRRTVLDKRASASRPGVGLVRHRWEALNQRGELVFTMEGWGMFGRKPA